MQHALFEYHVKYANRSKPDLFGVVPYRGETVSEEAMKIEAEGFHTGPLTEGDELNVRIVKKFNNDKEFIDAIKGSPVFDYLHRINNYAGGCV